MNCDKKLGAVCHGATAPFYNSSYLLKIQVVNNHHLPLLLFHSKALPFLQQIAGHRF